MKFLVHNFNREGTFLFQINDFFNILKYRYIMKRKLLQHQSAAKVD